MKLKNTLANRVANDSYQAKVYWCSEWQEYQVRLFVNGLHIRNATYHTDCHDDALSTAKVMCHISQTMQGVDLVGK